MTHKNLATIFDLLSRLHGHAYIRPNAGPLRAQLTQAVLDAVDGELAEELSEGGFDLEISIGRQEGDSEPAITYSVDRPGVVFQSQMAVTLLNEGAVEDLSGYLQQACQSAAPAEEAAAGKTVLRKRPEGDHHEKGAAAARLKVSPEWLKSVVPCTDYSYDEIDGKKYIREYYWSKELIERLFKIKSTKTTPEDLQYVAAECCDGDMEWARDLIARLKSPNRPEPAAKGESQKGQGRSAQNVGRAVQTQGKALAAQGKAAPAQGRGAQNPDRPASAKAVPSERVRPPRSRHKKPFRDQAKDAAQKSEPAAAQKPPQS